MIVPYVSLQLSGLQILLRIAGYGAYDATAAVCIAFIILALFVFSAGLRGTAWASVVKDVLVLGAVIFAGIAIPIRFFGSPSAMFDRVLAIAPADAGASDWQCISWNDLVCFNGALVGDRLLHGPAVVQRRL